MAPHEAPIDQLLLPPITASRGGLLAGYTTKGPRMIDREKRADFVELDAAQGMQFLQGQLSKTTQPGVTITVCQ